MGRIYVVPDDAEIIRVSQLRASLAEGKSLEQLGKEYGLSKSYLSRIFNGKRVKPVDGRK